MTNEFVFGDVPIEAYGFPIMGFGFAVLGFLGWKLIGAATSRDRALRPIVRGERKLLGVLAFCFGAFGLGFGVLSVVSFVYNYNHLKVAIRDNRVEVLSGCLAAFKPSTSQGHTPDIIRIGKRQLDYSDNIIGFGFHTTEISGGPIHADSFVRMVLVGDTIVRLDVQQNACPPAPTLPALKVTAPRRG